MGIPMKLPHKEMENHDCLSNSVVPRVPHFQTRHICLIPWFCWSIESLSQKFLMLRPFFDVRTLVFWRLNQSLDDLESLTVGGLGQRASHFHPPWLEVISHHPKRKVVYIIYIYTYIIYIYIHIQVHANPQFWMVYYWLYHIWPNLQKPVHTALPPGNRAPKSWSKLPHCGSKFGGFHTWRFSKMDGL